MRRLVAKSVTRGPLAFEVTLLLRRLAATSVMRRLAGGLALTAAASLAMGCRCTDPAPAPAASASAAAPKPLTPLAASSWIQDLPVPGFGAAKVALPLGTVQPRRVIVALHGGFDRPEWQCGHWAAISGGHAFVLCPQGVAKAGRFTWSSADKTAAELRAALKALKQRHGDYVAPGSVVLAGYGPGADHALLVAKQEPSFFSALALIEGGTKDFSSTLAAGYRQRGGQRMLFLCAHPGCEKDAERAHLLSMRAGVDAKLVHMPTEQKLMSPKVVRALASNYAWLAPKPSP